MSFLNTSVKSVYTYLLIIAVIGINVASIKWHTRIDLTAEKRFTLSNATKQLLKKIDQPIVIDVLLKGSYPSGFKKLASSTEDILLEYKEIAGNQLQFRFVAPDELLTTGNSSYADTIASMGLYPINLTSQLKEGQQQQNVYPFAILHYQDKLFPIELYKGTTPLINFQELNSAEAMLEYNLSNAIALAIQKSKPLVGFAIGNGEPMDIRVFDLAENSLKRTYDLQLINLVSQSYIPNEFKSIIIVKPTLSFTDAEKLKIDQYIMNGGKVLFFIDKLNAEMDSLQMKNEVIAYDRDLNVNDLLFKYGVRINSSLVMDLQCDYLPFDVNGNGQYDFLPWNYFPVLESSNNHPINKNLGYVVARFANAIDTVGEPDIKKTILLHSSLNGRVMATPALISGKENVTAPEDEKYKTANIPVAVLLEGKFRSLFANRLTNDLADSLQKAAQVLVTNCIEENKILVVSDGDIVMNAVVKGNQPLPMGENPYTYGTQRAFPFANKAFLMNALDYMINENGLSEAKGKDFVVRLLDNKRINDSKLYWQLLNIGLPILIVLFFAFIFLLIRKKKYTM